MNQQLTLSGARSVAMLATCFVIAWSSWASADEAAIRVGMIGLDTSHVVAFTKVLNDAEADEAVSRCRVVAAYPKGSPDIESSVRRVPGYTAEVRALGVDIVDSIDELLRRVDAVLLETNDGRPHLEQLRPVLKAGKPVFVDKPMAASLTDVLVMFEEAKAAGVPIFSSSALRFGSATQRARNGELGVIQGAETHSPASIEKTHPDLFWYGIHGVESLFTAMGCGCESVRRYAEEGKIVVEGTWSGERLGVFREGKGYGGSVQCEKGSVPIGTYDGYQPLLIEIVQFFRTGQPPVTAQETIEIYAFMAAADESKRRGGATVRIAETIAKAKGETRTRNIAK